MGKKIFLWILLCVLLIFFAKRIRFLPPLVSIIALQTNREILKKYRKRTITLPKNTFFQNIEKTVFRLLFLFLKPPFPRLYFSCQGTSWCDPWFFGTLEPESLFQQEVWNLLSVGYYVLTNLTLPTDLTANRYLIHYCGNNR